MHCAEALLASILPIHPSYSCQLESRDGFALLALYWLLFLLYHYHPLLLLWLRSFAFSLTHTHLLYIHPLPLPPISIHTPYLTTPHLCLYVTLPPFTPCLLTTLVPVVTNAECNVALVLSLRARQNPWFFLLSFQTRFQIRLNSNEQLNHFWSKFCFCELLTFESDSVKIVGKTVLKVLE